MIVIGRVKVDFGLVFGPLCAREPCCWLAHPGKLRVHSSNLTVAALPHVLDARCAGDESSPGGLLR